MHRCTTRGRGRPRLPFLKIEKSVLIWVKCSIQNIVLGVSWRKNSKMFPFRTSFSGVFNKIFIEVPYFHKPLSPVFLKILWLYICTQALVFLENTFKCLTVFWICGCLGDCRVIYTVTLCYMLHLTNSEF